MSNPRLRRPLLGLLIPLLLGGCGPPHNELTPVVEEMTRRQAAQQEAVVRQSQDLSKASQQLVESDAQARRELAKWQAEVQSQIESERQAVDQERDSLEGERREIARQRHRDPLIAAALIQAATLLVAIMPLVLVLFLLRAARNEPADIPLAELLVHELSAEQPLLLPGPVAPPSVTALPSPDRPPGQ